LSTRTQPAKSHANSGEHGVGEIARHGLVQRLVGLGPGPRGPPKIQPQGHGPEQLYRQEREAGRVGGHPADYPLDLDIAEAGQHPPGEGAQVGRSEGAQPNGDAAYGVTQPAAECIQLGSGRMGVGGEQEDERR